MNLVSLIFTLIFYVQIAVGDNAGYAAVFRSWEPAPTALCLPVGAALSEPSQRLYLGWIDKATLIDTLVRHGAHCNPRRQLIDAVGKQIAFYYEDYCSGATPDATTSAQQDNVRAETLNKLASYDTIILPCHPLP